jgi:hypothetical protein
VSSTIITGRLPLWFLAMDRIFTPYRLRSIGRRRRQFQILGIYIHGQL